MSDVVINKQFKVGGVLTNVDSFTLGVTRNDTQGQVVAPGTAMTNESTGEYSYTFASVGSGVSYTATFVVVYGGTTTTWAEEICAVGCCKETIDLPCLTGDYLWDTLNVLLWQRLTLLRTAPMVSYSLHGHKFNQEQYMRYLDSAVLQLRMELAQIHVVEGVSYNGGCDDWGCY